MMKTLLIIRHAKSDWNHPDLSDHDRPLNQRGLESLKTMTSVFSELEQLPQKVLCSTSKRTQSTLEGFAPVLGKNIPVEINRLWYLASERTWLSSLCEQADQFDHLAIVGHNPGLTDLAEYLSGQYIGNLPTCGMALISFQVSSWKELSRESGKLEFLRYPKGEV